MVIRGSISWHSRLGTARAANHLSNQMEDKAASPVT